MMRIIFSHKLLLTNTQVSGLREAFANNSLAHIKSSNCQITKLHKTMQSGEFSCRLLGSLLKTGLLLMKNVLKQLAESILVPLGLTAAASQKIQIFIRKCLDQI